MILQVLILIIGFVFLIKGADIFVDGASCTARHLKISKKFIGLTIVAFGTSAPEFAVSLKSILIGSGDIVLGNVIGSNILNILLILGIGSTIYPITIKDNTVKKEIPLCLITSILLLVLFMDSLFNGTSYNTFSRGDAWAVLLVFLIFLYYIFTIARSKTDNKIKEDKIKYGVVKSIIFIILGLAAIVLGSDMVVDSATEIAKSIGISERIISLTIIALGTSLPELATTISSSLKKEQDILVGNIIGSNIFNICFVLGFPVALCGNITSTSFNYIDSIFFVLAPILLYIFSRRTYKLDKLEGISLILLFFVYYMLVFIF